MVLRINFFIDTILPTFQRRFSVVSTLLITIQIMLTLRWKWNKIRNWIFNVAKYWYSAGIQCWSNRKSTLHDMNATVFQRYAMSFQRCFNIDMTLSQNCFNMASSSVKAMSKQVWLVKSTDNNQCLIQNPNI